MVLDAVGTGAAVVEVDVDYVSVGNVVAGDGVGANFVETPPGEGVVAVAVAFVAVVAPTVAGAEVAVGSLWEPGVRG